MTIRMRNACACALVSFYNCYVWCSSDAQLEAMGIDVALGSAMGVFDLYRAVSAGTHKPADPVVVASVVAALKAKLSESPLPVQPGNASGGAAL